MSTSLIIVYIFANNAPVFKIERFFAKNLIGVDQPVENKAVRVS